MTARSLRLSRARRLSERQEFQRFFKSSELIKFKECLVFRTPNGRRSFRMGMTIKKRCSGVGRSRLKRVIRESLRVNSETLGAFDYNVVLLPHHSINQSQMLLLRQRLRTELPRRLSSAAKA